ncbi:MAG TPA: pteridine-dependent deoxygenase [Luteimonas sp.]|jgi:chorismate lyase/3-hydroxybenzoate synthase|nr:pteridine-dependent deoxygenase [Luteimonas sp.]
MQAVQPAPVVAASLAVDYVHGAAPASLLAADDVLAVFGFGDQAPQALGDARYLRIPLQPFGDAPCEVWRGGGPVRHGRDGDIAWSSDGALSFGAIEVDERAHACDADPTGIVGAAAQAYARMLEFVGASATPHLLRVWNYLDAITSGQGDGERYRQFCVGRARGLGAFDAMRLPAATAIGRCDAARVLQVYWLSAAAPGTPVENPRQVSAWRYPREYGPQPPSFARAMLPPTDSCMPLLLSGTASVVGHATMHAGALLAQLGETFANFEALLGAARQRQPALPAEFGAGTRLKVYVRDRDDMPAIAHALRARFGDRVPHFLLRAAICRRDLAVEIDGAHGL